MLRMLHNETLVPKPLQGVSMWFSDRNIKKKKAWEPFKVILALFSFKKGVRQKKKIQKFVCFILKKGFFEDLRSSKLIFSKLSL